MNHGIGWIQAQCRFRHMEFIQGSVKKCKKSLHTQPLSIKDMPVKAGIA